MATMKVEGNRSVIDTVTGEFLKELDLFSDAQPYAVLNGTEKSLTSLKKSVSADSLLTYVFVMANSDESTTTKYLSMTSSANSYEIPASAISAKIYEERTSIRKYIGEISFISIDGTKTDSYNYESRLMTASLDSSGAKTVYIRTEADDTDVSHDGAKLMVNGVEVTATSNGGALTWNDPVANPAIAGTYSVTCRCYPFRHEIRRNGAVVGYHASDIRASYKITSRPFSPIGIKAVGEDSNYYWDDGSTGFKKPTYTNFTVIYDNGDEIYVNPKDSRVEYFADDTPDAIGISVTSDTKIFVRIKTGDFVSNVFTSVAPLALDVRAAVASSAKASGEFLYGATPRSQSSKMKVTAAFVNGTEKELSYGEEDGFYFDLPDKPFRKGDALDVFVDSYGHVSGPFDISGDGIFKNPGVSETAVSKGKRLATTISNGSAIDLSDTILKVSYDGSDEVASLVLGDGSEGTFKASCADLPDIISFDGTEDVKVDLEGKTSKAFALSLSGKDAYGNPVSASLGITVYDVLEIIGLSVISAKTDYKVGESFLNDDDGTMVKMWFNSSSDGAVAKESVTVPLNGSIGSLTVYPAKGTVFSSSGKVTVRVQSVFDTTKFVTYDITVEPDSRSAGDNETLSFVFVKNRGGIKRYETKDGECRIPNNAYMMVLQSDCERSKGDGSWSLRPNLSFASGYDGEGAKIHGYLKNVGTSSNGTLVCFEDYSAPITGASNMTIKFPCHDEDSSSFVDKCTFGTRFGHNNSLNRLFISGNPDHPNYDIHSAEPNLTNEDEATQVSDGDFSYFPDEAICQYGESENAVVGYDAVSDSKLMILKGKSAKEKTVYFRVPSTVSMVDSSGTVMKDVSGNSLTQEEYSVYVSNSSVAGVSPNSVANFNGDTVFLDSENEIAGLDIEGIIGDSQRQANTRSYYIDRKLKGLDMSDANLEVFGRNLILDIPGVAAFVTDRESKSSSQYEWWRIDSLGSACFMELDGTLYYATTDGHLCRLSDGYLDKERSDADVALYDIDYTNDIIVSSESTDFIADGHDYSWRTKPKDQSYNSHIYARLLDVGEGGEGAIDAESNSIKVTDIGLMRKINRGQTLYMTAFDVADSAIESNYGKEFRLQMDGLEAGVYKLYDESLDEVDLSKFENGFELCLRLDGEITARRSADGQISLIDDSDGKPYDLVKYGSQTPMVGISGVITRLTPISSRLVSAPLMISSANWFKHVIKIDISQGTDDVSDICVAYCNNKIPYIVEDSVMDRGQTIDLGDFSFSSVDFSENFYTRTYTIGRELKCVKYVCVAFASDKGMNSVVPAVSLSYTLSRLSKGIGD